MRNTPAEEHVPVREEAELELIAEFACARGEEAIKAEPAGTVFARAKTAIVAAERKWPGSIGRTRWRGTFSTERLPTYSPQR